MPLAATAAGAPAGALVPAATGSLPASEGRRVEHQASDNVQTIAAAHAAAQSELLEMTQQRCDLLDRAYRSQQATVEAAYELSRRREHDALRYKKKVRQCRGALREQADQLQHVLQALQGAQQGLLRQEAELLALRRQVHHLRASQAPPPLPLEQMAGGLPLWAHVGDAQYFSQDAALGSPVISLPNPHA